MCRSLLLQSPRSNLFISRDNQHSSDAITKDNHCVHELNEAEVTAEAACVRSSERRLCCEECFDTQRG